MTLKPCPECNAEVSDSAEVCPHCGYRLVGRESLVHCSTCNADVIPVRHMNDTVSRFCPFCERPLTNLTARKVLFVLVILFILGTVAILFGFFDRLS